MKMDCKMMTGVIYNCPNLSECLENSPLHRMEALLLYCMNQEIEPENIKIDGQRVQLSEILEQPTLLLRASFAYNTDYETRDIIIFGNPVQWDSSCGGVYNFSSLPVDSLQQLIAQGFVNPIERQNDAPTIQAFVAFAREQAVNGVDFTFQGYAVSPFREDYRVSIDGILFRGTYPHQVLAAFHQFVRGADDISVNSEYLFAWWD
jgi:hypothetical protein